MIFKKYRSLKKDRADDYEVRRQYYHAKAKYVRILAAKPELDEETKLNLIKDYDDLNKAEFEWETQNSDYYCNRGYTIGYIFGILGAVAGYIVGEGVGILLKRKGNK